MGKICWLSGYPSALMSAPSGQVEAGALAIQDSSAQVGALAPRKTVCHRTDRDRTPRGRVPQAGGALLVSAGASSGLGSCAADGARLAVRTTAAGLGASAAEERRRTRMAGGPV